MRRRGPLLAGALLLIVGAGPLAADPAVTNDLAPTQLMWNVMGELGNGAGLSATANGFAPGLPIFGGITAGWYYGVDSSHVAGDRNGVLTRFMLGHDELELRAGVDLARWFVAELGSHYDHSFSHGADGSTRYISDRYSSAVPAYGRRGVYAGVRLHHPHAGARCPDDGTLPEDCVDVPPRTPIPGPSFFHSAAVKVNPARPGLLELRRHRLIELRALFTPADGYARTSLAKQLGGEVMVTYGGNFRIAVKIGGGWDGDMLLLKLGFGMGAPRSFTGAAPDAATIMR